MGQSSKSRIGGNNYSIINIVYGLDCSKSYSLSETEDDYDDCIFDIIENNDEFGIHEYSGDGEDPNAIGFILESFDQGDQIKTNLRPTKKQIDALDTFIKTLPQGTLDRLKEENGSLEPRVFQLWGTS